MTRASQAGLPVSCPQCAGPFSGWHPMFTTQAVVKTAVSCVGCGRRWVITTTLRPERESDRLDRRVSRVVGPQPEPVLVSAGQCVVCGDDLAPSVKPRRYCSGACRNAAYRARKGAA